MPIVPDNPATVLGLFAKDNVNIECGDISIVTVLPYLISPNAEAACLRHDILRSSVSGIPVGLGLDMTNTKHQRP